MIISLLLVESESSVKSNESAMLSKMGFAVTIAETINDAKKKLKEKRFDILMTDLVVNGVSGFKLLDEIKQKDLHLPVIMMSAKGTVKDAVEALQFGASDFLLKPANYDTLKETIQKAVNDAFPNAESQAQGSSLVAYGKNKKLITVDAEFMQVIETAKKVAPSRATILITGESGTGKELLASFVHANSNQKGHDYVAMNCAALPENLAESELFGHEKGAFTGALNKRIGKFESAKNGTLVLDEISEMPLQLQAKLLRVMQEKEVDRVGGTKTIPVNTRIIAITNKDLQACIEKGSFREDLYYRINVIPLKIPPLRHRTCDIPILSEYFLKKYCRMNSAGMEKIDKRAMDLLMKNKWKGNVRELENCMERGVLIGDGNILLPEHLLLDPTQTPGHELVGVNAGNTVREMEKQLIFNTLKKVNENRTHASRMLGISIRTLRNKLKEYRQETALTKKKGDPE